MITVAGRSFQQRERLVFENQKKINVVENYPQISFLVI